MSLTSNELQATALDKEAPGQPVRADVVILVHGIRTYSFWQMQLKPLLRREGFEVELTNYGRFDLIRFLMPIPYFRRKAIAKVWRQIEQAVLRHPGARISIIAHSFGSYIVAKILEDRFNFTAHKVIFCGSVVPYDFPFEQIASRFSAPILNDVGSRDFLPALAESVTWGYGSAGTYGFRRPFVEDRWHLGFGHSDFLNAEFAANNWARFLKGEAPSEGTSISDPPSLWIQALSILRLKYVILTALIVFAFVGLSRAYLVHDEGWDLGVNNNSSDSVAYWAQIFTTEFFENELGAECPFQALPFIDCRDGVATQFLTGRRYPEIIRVDGDALRSVVSCGRFTHRTTDPLSVIEALAMRFPSCVSIEYEHDGLAIEVNKDAMGPKRMRCGKEYLMCGCTSEQILNFENPDCS